MKSIEPETEKLLEVIHDTFISVNSLRLRGLILKKSENTKQRINGIKAVKTAEKIYGLLELLSADLRRIDD